MLNFTLANVRPFLFTGLFCLAGASVLTAQEQTPFLETGPHAIPGTIEFEDFDNGGQGISWNEINPADKAPNQGGSTYRGDADVDIEDRPEADGMPARRIVGYVGNGEWLEYTVDVAEAGEYSIEAVVGVGRAGAELGLSIPGEDSTRVLVENQYFFATEGFNDYKTVAFDDPATIMLKAGVQVLRVNIVNFGFNLDNITFTKVGGGSTSVFSAPKVAQLSISPNPSSNGRFLLDEVADWKVYSLVGQMVAAGQGREIDLSLLDRGTYVVRTATAMRKVIFQ
ncbi:carbohydrate-binding protein [Neolewinella antarctica]|uniref:CBM6 domain-containing protein n=1 Tax=Neolewinella antarctica TaxID=442734 RepID=A0ABX0XGW8_9BACT|nr:carbohydrate-binding protein [Neolewinella antarctica]NJC28456.1 hypothetical protein [Neolewinella antarctica]